MTSDDQQFLEYLGGVTSSINKFVSDIGPQADKAVDSVRNGVKSMLISFGLKSKAIPPAPPIVHQSFFEKSHQWISNHKAITTAIVAFIGTGAIGILILYSQNSRHKPRRARKAKNGARKEVVVVAGPPASPLVRSIYHDLERRGFITYVIATCTEDRLIIERESKADVIPLTIDLSDAEQAVIAVEKFHQLINTPVQAFPGASTHYVDFKGLVVALDQDFPYGPIQHLSTDVWSDALSTKLLSTINITRAFFPLIVQYQSRIIITTPVILASLCLPNTAVESVTVNALEAYIKTLQREARTHNISVSHIQLGAIDFGISRLVEPRYQQSLAGIKGSNARELHISIFDALTLKNPFSSRRVGKGSFLYGMSGNLIPSSLVDWLLGSKRPPISDGWQKIDQVKQS